MQAQKQKRIFEVTVGQIGISLLIAAIALTAVFEAGVLVGKKRGIKAALEAEQQNDRQTRSPMKVSTQANLPGTEPADQPAKQPYPAEEVLTEPELPRNPLSDQPAEELIEKAAQYTVQVGVFNSRENAEGLVNLLKSHEYESWLEPRSVADKTLYFVFAGRFEMREEADKLGRLMQDRLSYITDYKVIKVQNQD
jgi:cell division septation protein DedD